MDNTSAREFLHTAGNGAMEPAISHRQDFPPNGPSALVAEGTALASLTHHCESVEASVALELAYDLFRTRHVDYMAVVRDGRVIGLCSRGEIGFVMGSRFGFSLYSHSPVETVLVRAPLVVALQAPVREVLDRALARTGESFHQDVVLVDGERRLVGLVRAESLAQLQSQLVAQQLDALRQQHEILRQQHMDLFRANHAVRQSKGLYLGLFEGHSLGVALLDVDGGIHEHNRRLAELLGFGDTLASLISLVAWVEERERPTFLAMLRAQAEGRNAPASKEFTLHITGRGARFFRCSTGWIQETGQICACLDDITDQRLLERKLARQEKQTLLDTLVGGIAHELNNKLTPVMGFAGLLSIDGTEDDRRHVHYIQQSVQEAAHIIRQLLQLSKPIAHVTQPVEFRTVVEETLLMLRFQIRAAHCEVVTRLSAEPVWVMADPGQLKQVTINLVLNALQAIEGLAASAITVELRPAGTQAMLHITDSGCGSPEENLGRIFDPFFTTKGPERGTGLGLSICYSIVRQHGGEISVESQPGAGARFTVSLPLDTGAASAFVPTRRDMQPTRGVRPVPSTARVLVVDDDEIVRNLLQELVRRQFGCQVDVVSHGGEALLALEREHYALILSDIQMPVMNGMDLYRRVRELHPTMARRFVFITGHPGDRVLVGEIGAWDIPVIGKPFSLERLADVCGPLISAVH